MDGGSVTHTDCEGNAFAIDVPRWVAVVAWLVLALSALAFALNLPLVHSYVKIDTSAYYYAGNLVALDRAASLYEATDVVLARSLGIPASHGPSRYIYPPVLAVCLAPLSRMPYYTMLTVWVILSLVGLAVAAAGLRYAVALQGWRGRLMTPLICILMLNMGCIQADLCWGNINWFVLMTLTWSLCFCLRNRQVAAGAVLAISVLVKVAPAMFAAPYLFRRNWRALCGLAGAVGVVLLLTVLRIGYEPVMRYRDVFDGRLFTHRLHEDVQSVYSFVYRLLHGTMTCQAVIDLPHLAAPVSACLSVAILATGIAMVWLRRGDTFYCYSVLAVTMTMASPVTWRQQLVVLALPLSYLIGRCFNADSVRSTAACPVRVLLGTFALVFLLVAQITGAVLPTKTLPGVLWTSREFLGQCVLWFILLWLGGRDTISSRNRPSIEPAQSLQPDLCRRT